MTDEIIFNASKTMAEWWAEFYKEVVVELGEEKTIELMLKHWDQRAHAFAQRLIEERQVKDIDLTRLANDQKRFFAGLGWENDVQVTSTSYILTTKKCPLYDGFQTAGIAPESLSGWCCGVARVYDEALKAFSPNARYKLKFRASPDDVCVEEIILKD